MSVKQQLLKEINSKAKKIKEKREKAKNDPAKQIVFDFFRNMDDVAQMTNTHGDWRELTLKAFGSLMDKMRSIDKDCFVDVQWIDNVPQGVTITWSEQFALNNKIENKTYIDVSEMLLY